MKYYTASLFYRSEHTPPLPKKEALWEEKIVLIKSDSAENAELIAKNYGEKDRNEYRTESHGLVRWLFVKVERVIEVERDIKEEVLPVFWRFLNDAEANSILKPLE